MQRPVCGEAGVDSVGTRRVGRVGVECEVSGDHVAPVHELLEEVPLPLADRRQRLVELLVRVEEVHASLGEVVPQQASQLVPAALRLDGLVGGQVEHGVALEREHDDVLVPLSRVLHRVAQEGVVPLVGARPPSRICTCGARGVRRQRERVLAEPGQQLHPRDGAPDGGRGRVEERNELLDRGRGAHSRLRVRVRRCGGEVHGREALLHRVAREVHARVGACIVREGGGGTLGQRRARAVTVARHSVRRGAPPEEPRIHGVKHHGARASVRAARRARVAESVGEGCAECGEPGCRVEVLAEHGELGCPRTVAHVRVRHRKPALPDAPALGHALHLRAHRSELRALAQHGERGKGGRPCDARCVAHRGVHDSDRRSERRRVARGACAQHPCHGVEHARVVRGRPCECVVHPHAARPAARARRELGECWRVATEGGFLGRAGSGTEVDGHALGGARVPRVPVAAHARAQRGR